MSGRQVQTILSIATLAALLCMQQPVRAQDDIDEDHRARTLAVLNYVTGWSLDSAGYHPAVYMLLENISGRDLSGVTIKMQGKFTDIHTLEPSTAKLEIRRSLKPHQQFRVALVAPREFELPRDTNFWPVMECKAMLRAGDVGDEGTEYLLVTRVDHSTATQDDAFQKLNELTSFKGSSHSSTHPSHHQPHSHTASHNPASSSQHPQAPKGLKATADRISSSQLVAPISTSRNPDIFSQKALPGLGEDFYSFEKAFGLPLATDAKRKDFTWAKFRQQASSTEIIVGSKERSGKADLIAFLVSRDSVKNEQELIDKCRLFAGLQKNVKAGPVSKSVRYLPAGRIELMNSTAAGLRIYTVSLPDSSSKKGMRLVIISRLSQEPDELLRNQQPGNEVLQSLPLQDTVAH